MWVNLEALHKGEYISQKDDRECWRQNLRIITTTNLFTKNTFKKERKQEKQSIDGVFAAVSPESCCMYASCLVTHVPYTFKHFNLI